MLTEWLTESEEYPHRAPSLTTAMLSTLPGTSNLAWQFLYNFIIHCYAEVLPSWMDLRPVPQKIFHVKSKKLCVLWFQYNELDHHKILHMHRKHCCGRMYRNYIDIIVFILTKSCTKSFMKFVDRAFVTQAPVSFAGAYRMLVEY